MQRTKIISTIGPASERLEDIKKMIANGMDVARLNMSHNVYSYHKKMIANIRQAEKDACRPITIIEDLQGPRIRVGIIPSGTVTLKKGEKVALVPDYGKKISKKIKTIKEIPIQLDNFQKYLKVGSVIYIDDAMVELRALEKSGERVICEVLNDAIVKTHKGINIPGAKINIPAITSKDLSDLDFGIANKVDFVALSFVKSAKEILVLRKKISELEKKYHFKPVDYNKPSLKGKWSKIATRVIAKIETPEAVKNFDEILEATDAVMVARGDLGLEMPIENLPLIQKKLISKCLHAAKPVIVATQMLNSMITNPVPTRAEVSDVANAIIDGSDAVMLSGETASGKYPIKAVNLMDKIAKQTEKVDLKKISEKEASDEYTTTAMAIEAKILAEEIKAKAIVCTTTSGFAARSLSRLKPKQPIIALTPSLLTARQLNLSWGVYPSYFKQIKSFDLFIKIVRDFLAQKGIAKKGEKIVLLISHPVGFMGESNLVKAETL